MAHGTVAQLVEHRPFKPRVVGSIPTGPTTQDTRIKMPGVLFYRKSPSPLLSPRHATSHDLADTVNE